MNERNIEPIQLKKGKKKETEQVAEAAEEEAIRPVDEDDTIDTTTGVGVSKRRDEWTETVTPLTNEKIKVKKKTNY